MDGKIGNGARVDFHSMCQVDLVDVGGIPHLWCRDCHVYADLGTHVVEKAGTASEGKLTNAVLAAKRAAAAGKEAT